MTRPADRVRRSRVVLAALALGALLLAAGSATWASGQVLTVLGEQDVAVSGTTAAPGLVAAALVVAAAALAVAIGRRVGAALGGLAMVGAASVVVAVVTGFLSDPAAPLRASAAEVSGVPRLAGTVTVGVWPYVTLALAVLAAAAGVLAVVAGRTWGGAGRRFERPAAGVGSAGARSAVGRAGDARTRAMDDWDALGRGEDPTQDAEGRGERPPT
ncbi:hypothetical protein GCM10023169_16500 [Georgenia halophila]|uniref:Trp biosynthesis-associated membrane protein n=1 Tax=Georgenia halophila TaxID=620889 RepID=A0ABP8L5Y2_9MICO